MNKPTNTLRNATAFFLPPLTIAVYIAVASIGAFSGGLWGGCGIGLGVLLFLGTAYLNRTWPNPSHDFLWLALVTLTLIALLNLGTVDAGLSWFDWKRLVTIFLPLVLLSSPGIVEKADHKNLFHALIIAAFLGAFTLGVELLLDAPVLRMAKGDQAALTRYNRGLSYLVILALPIMAALWIEFQNHKNKFLPVLFFIAVMLFPTSLTESRAAKLAFVMALITAIIAKFLPRLAYRGLGVLVFLLLGWPLYVQKAFLLFQDKLGHLPPSWRARVEIWDYMSYRIFEHPWLGWGLGTSKTLDFKNPHGDLYQLVSSNAPHPHNVVTQLWVELGLPGLALGVAFALLTLRQASRLAPPLVPFALGAWVAALCLSLVAYNFWTDSMFAAFALTGLAFAILDRRLSKRPI